jgi:TetR/AcrR family fatty acid metabolism transcriptional regulator
MRAKTAYKKSEASRQQVLDAAVKTLAKRGFTNTSVSDIAETAGMSKGVVHYHFASKEDLIVRVLGQCYDALSARIKAAWGEGGTPSDRVRRALREMWASRTDGSAEMTVLADMMAQGVHDAKIRRALAARFTASRSELASELSSAFEKLGLRPKLPVDVVSRIVMATLDGIGLHHIFDPPNEAEQAEIARSLELFAFSLFEL